MYTGRPIAIDWAIPKKQYASQDSTPNDNVVSIKEKVDLKNDDKKDGNESEEVEEDENDVDKDEDEDNEDDDEDDDEDDEEDDEEDEDDEDEEKEDEKGGKKQKNSNRDWSGFDSVTEQKSDVDEGKTVFLRNLDFSTTEDSLKNYMTTFGSMHYALLCMDKVMERPKGTAFVKFKVIYTYPSETFWTFFNVLLFVFLRNLRVLKNVLWPPKTHLYYLTEVGKSEREER